MMLSTVSSADNIQERRRYISLVKYRDRVLYVHTISVCYLLSGYSLFIATYVDFRYYDAFVLY